MKYEHKDCLAFLKSLDDESVDLVIVDPPYFEIVKDTIVKKRRWSIDHQLIIRHLPTGKCYICNYSVGATECQEEMAWDYEEANFRECEPVQVTTIEWKLKE